MKKIESLFVKFIITALIVIVLSLGYGVIQEVLRGEYFSAMFLSIIALLLSRLTTLLSTI